MYRRIRIATINCHGLRNNIMYIKLLQSNNSIVFLQETWCSSKAEVTNLLGTDTENKIHSIIDAKNENLTRRGRYVGGLTWIIRKEIGKYTVNFINERISVVIIGRITIIGVYLISNNNKIEDYNCSLTLMFIKINIAYNLKDDLDFINFIRNCLSLSLKS